MNHGTPFTETENQVRLAEFSDMELLLELSRRRRFLQINLDTTTPFHAVELGYPKEEQIIETFRNVGFEIGTQMASGLQLPGCEFSEVPTKTGLIGKKDRRFKAQLTFVVNKR